MITETAIVACIVCVVYILYLINKIQKLEGERMYGVTFKPEVLDGAHVHILWRDAEGKPYARWPNGVQLKDANFDKESFTFTFASA